MQNSRTLRDVGRKESLQGVRAGSVIRRRADRSTQLEAALLELDSERLFDERQALRHTEREGELVTFGRGPDLDLAPVIVGQVKAAQSAEDFVLRAAHAANGLEAPNIAEFKLGVDFVSFGGKPCRDDDVVNPSAEGRIGRHTPAKL